MLHVCCDNFTLVRSSLWPVQDVGDNGRQPADAGRKPVLLHVHALNFAGSAKSQMWLFEHENHEWKQTPLFPPLGRCVCWSSEKKIDCFHLTAAAISIWLSEAAMLLETEPVGLWALTNPEFRLTLKRWKLPTLWCRQRVMQKRWKRMWWCDLLCGRGHVVIYELPRPLDWLGTGVVGVLCLPFPLACITLSSLLLPLPLIPPSISTSVYNIFTRLCPLGSWYLTVARVSSVKWARCCVRVFREGECASLCVPVGLRMLMTADKAHAAEISLAVWSTGKARMLSIL